MRKNQNNTAERESCIESSSKHGTKRDVYDMINERILALLDQGTNPWRKPWISAAQKPPQNLISRKPYRGINTLLLGMAPYESPYWLTYKQATEAGGTVRKGEKASIAVFWKMLDVVDHHTQEGTQVPMLRYYSVFNVEQCEGVQAPQEPVETFEHNSIELAEALVAAMPNPPAIVNESNRQAYYRLEKDHVNMPLMERFQNVEEYYSTLFHELTHATGHKSRLDRAMSGSFGSVLYGREELIAEMGAAYLCGLANILDRTANNTAAYLDGWRRTIKEDKRAVVVAAGAAQKAVDYITNQIREERLAA